MAADLEKLVARLEVVTGRLESVASRGGGSGGGSSASNGAYIFYFYQYREVCNLIHGLL